MKRTKMIALTLVMVILLMGAGYAYWSDTLTINNTVSTGEFEVAFTEYTILDPLPLIITTDNEGEDYMDSDISANWSGKPWKKRTTDKLTVSVEDMYPNSLALYVGRIENLGTIPAVFGETEVSYTTQPENLAFKDQLIVAGGYMLFNEDDDYKQGDYFITNLSGLKETLDDMFEEVRMEPGDYMLLDIPPEYQSQVKEVVEPYNPDEQNCIIFYMPWWINNDDEIEDQRTVFDIKLNFKQHNAE